ncbi:MAG TPA: GNAT family N-acetyltransferase [Bacteroidia bacterium]|mgnify:FL=1|nr:GNAT family N-acetyltransferase [Bacteroidia bacterium]
MEQTIIAPVPKDILIAELSKDKFIRYTKNGKNEIYIVNYHNAPNVLREIGRLREITFRHAGGGTGKEIDLDEFDTSENCYQQLIVWDPSEKEIVGSYRYILCKNALKNNQLHLATSELFHFSQKFINEYAPYTIELGRSFIQPKYQPTEDYRKGLFSLDNLWDGLGALVVDYPDMKYFFGKVTMYTHFNREARDLILGFMRFFFPDKDNLVWPIHPIELENDISWFIEKIKGLSYKEAHLELTHEVKKRGERIPPLVNNYMNLSSTMRTFGTAINPGFGGVEETGLMVTIADIYPSKKDRYIQPYIEFLKQQGKKV